MLDTIQYLGVYEDLYNMSQSFSWGFRLLEVSDMSISTYAITQKSINTIEESNALGIQRRNLQLANEKAELEQVEFDLSGVDRISIACAED